MQQANSDGQANNEKERIEAVNAAIDACLQHATDLVRAARAVQAIRLPNIAYHLAVLALEEVGKSELIGMEAFSSRGEETREWVARMYEDHVRKLFFALWGPSFGREKITRGQIESFRGMAKRMHEMRLAGLYFDPAHDHRCTPRDIVTAEEAETLMRMAEVRIAMEQTRYVELDKATADDISWFAIATKDPVNRNAILGSKSMDKLSELREARLWIHWLREQFEEAERRGREAAERELRRPEPSEDEALEPKWKLKVRFHTNSHSIRPKALNWWNGVSDWIKLASAGDKKNELIAEFALPKAVSLDSLWWAGWGASRKFVVALNIASMGYFWWYVPEHVSRFYETLVDVETSDRLSVERSPILRLDWHRDALTEEDLKRAALCMGMLPGPRPEEKHEPFDHYIAGLAFLSKNDIHMQFERSAFEQFYKALKSGMRVYGDWDGVSPFIKAFDAIMCEVMPEPEECRRYVHLGERLEAARSISAEISLSEVGMMKVLCDAYFLQLFKQLVRDRVGSEATTHEKL